MFTPLILARFNKDRTGHIQFDELLMYVGFPAVKVIHSARRATRPHALGRQDIAFSFDWLCSKGVRRILMLKFKDNGMIPHSDEAIQISLDNIMVKHLDWQKVEFDP